MDTTKLFEGQTIKNYVELCSLLNKKPTTGSGRKSLFKELARYCDYSISGRTIKINRLFSMPKEKIRADAKWIESIALSILHKLAQQPKNPEGKVTTVYVENYQLALYVGLCDMYFYTARNNHNIQPDEKKKLQYAQEDFYKRATRKFSSVLHSVKTSLKDRHLVYFETAWKYDIFGGERDVEANEEVRTYISEAKAKALVESPYKTMHSLVKSIYFPQYKRNLAKILKEKHGIVNVKEYTKFHFTNSIHERIQNLYKELNLYDEVSKTNKLMVEYMEEKKIEFLNNRTYVSYPDRELKRVITVAEQKTQDMEEYQELIETCIKIYQEEENEFDIDFSEEQTNSQPGE